ncbi:hypothetical protein [Herbiconiux daphne]|uniref:Uncharacterized protein n=1 Tax=Herbiconiux daphne TaxID=2970914 RepID=A0ABT2H7W4_9MICO|nr:hypothetical protein [Herbiconiux daphne]MCS5736016.1 hypothetical protein [Herbiconiux daphne]
MASPGWGGVAASQADVAPSHKRPADAAWHPRSGRPLRGLPQVGLLTSAPLLFARRA